MASLLSREQVLIDVLPDDLLVSLGEEGHRVVEPVGVVDHVHHDLLQAAPAGIEGHQVERDVGDALEAHVEDVAEEVLRFGQRGLGGGLIVDDLGYPQFLHVGGLVDDRVEEPSAAGVRAFDMASFQPPPRGANRLINSPNGLDHGIVPEVLVVDDTAAQCSTRSGAPVRPYSAGHARSGSLAKPSGKTRIIGAWS